MGVNEVKINGEVIMSTRDTTVDEDNLLQDETAIDKAGDEIVGQLNPADDTEAYEWTDDTVEDSTEITNIDYIPFYDESEEEKKNITVGALKEHLLNDAYQTTDTASTDIDDSDYIPFNDVSDTSVPKKKTLFSNIIDKLKNTFLGKSWGHVELVPSSEYLYIKDTQVDATKADNDVSAKHYPSSDRAIDKNGKTLTAYETVIDPNGDISAKIYAQNFDTSGNAVGMNSIIATVDKSGNKSYSVTEPNKFREAIKTVDQIGVNIPNDSDLDTYMTAGTYRIVDDASAQTLVHCPITVCGKLIVSNNGNGGYTQFVIANHDTKIYARSYWSSAWSNWIDLTAGGGSSLPHTYELGTEIPANADLNTYTTVGVYQCELTATARTMSNLPFTGNDRIAFKLIVSKDRKNNNLIQWYIPYSTYVTLSGVPLKGTKLAYRTTDDNGTNWESWVIVATTDDISPSTVGNGYAVATISGSAITATIDGFQLRAGVIVAIHIPSSITTACTLNISNTGAKSIYVMKSTATPNPSDGRPLYGGTWLMMYDGTVYRAISYDRSPNVHSQSYVAGTSGNIVLDWGWGSDRAQLKHYVPNGKLSYNYYKNGAWRGDNVIAEYDDIIQQTLGVTIPANSDLDDYITNGIYNVNSNANASTIANMPCALAGKLIVMRKADNRYVTQYFMTYSSGDDKQLYNRSIDVNETTPTWTIWRSFVEQQDGYVRLYKETSTADDLPVGISAKIKDTTTGQTYINSIIRAYQDHQATPYGFNVLLGGGGSTFIGGGESALTHYNAMTKPVTTENIYMTSDGNIFLQGNGNTIANRQGFKINNAIQLIPVIADVETNNVGSIGTSNYKIANVYTNKLNGADVINADNIGGAIAKVGKSILPIWYETTNVITRSGITFTFNPITGETTANGTATADAWCPLFSGKFSTTKITLPKGSYALSGCPSGGSDSKYFLALFAGNSVWRDYGSGNTFTLSDDSLLDNDFSICIKSGQTVSNIVFKPMLRPAFTTADFEPCEDIHKGNIYVGTCTTSASEQTKVAYVDGYFVLRRGVMVAIKYSNTNTYSATADAHVKLNVNGTGAKDIYYNTGYLTGTGTGCYGLANRYIYYVYNGTDWVWVSHGNDNDGNNRKSFYGTCSTEAGTSAKVVTLSDTAGWELRAGTIVGVKFSNSNTASNVTLNVNGSGAKSIYYNQGVYTGSSAWACGTANRISYYMYDGTYWAWLSMGLELNDVEPPIFGIGYGTCATAEATTAKVVTLSNYTLRTGGYVTVKFTYAVPASATMNINSKGAKNIYYRGSAIKAGIITAGDLATFIYDGTQYNLIGTDSQDIKFDHSSITVISSINNVKTAYYAEGNLNGNQLFCRIELAFKPTANISLTSSDWVFTFNNMLLTTTNNFGWQDIQAYIGYTDMRPMLVGNSNNKMGIRFRSGQTFNANTTYTLRLNFTTTAVKI